MKSTVHAILRACLLPVLALLLAGRPAEASSLRCGNDLIYTGDPAYVVERKIERCGRILQRSVTGERKMREWVPFGHPFPESDRRYGRTTVRTVVIETWFVLVDSYTDYCYELTFEGGRLMKIGDFQDCE